MSHKVGLGSGFNDHKLLQYQLSSSPHYAYVRIQPKACRSLTDNMLHVFTLAALVETVADCSWRL